MPIDWGVMFELVFVKATVFWFTFAAFLTMEKWMLVLGPRAVTFIVGPFWHLRTARILTRGTQERVP